MCKNHDWHDILAKGKYPMENRICWCFNCGLVKAKHKDDKLWKYSEKKSSANGAEGVGYQLLK